jgi:hypothetical protein
MQVPSCESCLVNTRWCALTLLEEPAVIADLDAKIEAAQMGLLSMEVDRGDWDEARGVVNQIIEAEPVIDADDLIKRVENQLDLDTGDSQIQEKYEHAKGSYELGIAAAEEGRRLAIARLTTAQKLQAHILAGCGIESSRIPLTRIQKFRGKIALRNCGATLAPGLTDEEIAVVKDIEDGYERQLNEIAENNRRSR